jgi:hypothetical protein
MSDVDAVAAHSSDILVGMWHPAIRHGPASSRRPVDVIDATMGICASTRCCCATVGRFRPAIGSHRRRRCATRAAGDQLRKCHQLAKQGSRPCRVGVISSVVAKAWKCRLACTGSCDATTAQIRTIRCASVAASSALAGRWEGCLRGLARRLAGGGWRTAPLAQRGRFRTPWPLRTRTVGQRTGRLMGCARLRLAAAR